MIEDRARKGVDRIKNQGRAWSNIYSDEAFVDVEEIAEDENAVVFMRVDHGVKRLYFCANDANALVRQLSSETIKKNLGATIEFMTRDAGENAELFNTAGFTPIAHLMRMSTRDISQGIDNIPTEFYDTNETGTIPKEADAKEINGILWNIFDTRISHLQSNEEVAKAIDNKEFTVHKNQAGKIDALIQAQIQPRKFYINQIYNSTEKKVIHAMLLDRLMKYIEQGGKYVYAWVDRDNIASVKFHKKYGMAHDGMWNMVYAMETRS